MTEHIDASDKKEVGGPPGWLQIDCAPEELAQAIFANARPPDPSLRKRNREKEDK